MSRFTHWLDSIRFRSLQSTICFWRDRGWPSKLPAAGDDDRCHA